MAELPAVPAILSLEGRAQMIADETGRSAHMGQPDARRAHVKAHALAHMRAAIAQAENGGGE